jgi:hypothetical protein
MFEREFGPVPRGGGGQCCCCIKGMYHFTNHSVFYARIGMEVVIDYESLQGANNGTVIKELALVAKGVIRALHFQAPYSMKPHGSVEIGLNWEDGHIPYRHLQTAIDEALAGYAHLYAYGVEKCKLLSGLIHRPVLNIEDFKCPSPNALPPSPYSCGLPCHKFPNIGCPTRNAYSWFKRLLYHFKTKSYVKCPKDMTRHSATFISAV